jgi:hypothetical protein
MIVFKFEQSKYFTKICSLLCFFLIEINPGSLNIRNDYLSCFSLASDVIILIKPLLIIIKQILIGHEARALCGC